MAGLRASALESLIGNTPLVRLAPFEPKPGVELYAKLESRNPGGSVKDRAALSIVRDGERRTLLRPGGTLLDATSGNTGIAYAMLGAAKGFRVELCIPSSASAERKRILQAYGAQLHFTDAAEGSDGAIRLARELVKLHPGKYFYADQYDNPMNPRSHYDGTGPEIWQQTSARITHFVAGLGTTGTLMGTSKRLREFRPATKIIAVQPDSPMHGIEGLKHLPTALRPAIYDAKAHDTLIEVATDRAQTLTRKLARELGLFVGVSSGAALAGALDTARTLDKGVVVTIFPDGGERYLNDRFWDSTP